MRNAGAGGIDSIQILSSYVPYRQKEVIEGCSAKRPLLWQSCRERIGDECSLGILMQWFPKRSLGRQQQDLETCEKYKLLGPTPTKPTYWISTFGGPWISLNKPSRWLWYTVIYKPLRNIFYLKTFDFWSEPFLPEPWMEHILHSPPSVSCVYFSYSRVL